MFGKIRAVCTRRRAEQKRRKKLHISEKILSAQRTAVFEQPHTFSILVPLYNTPERFLKEMMESVLAQTYGDFQLCLADGSDEAHSYVGNLCREMAKQEPRICYEKLSKNRGIAENTNACLRMASGDYHVLFDHDDYLHPSALYEVQKAIEKTGADFLYTDEATFTGQISGAYCLHEKPDFSPDTLRSYNYICHLTVFSSELGERVGELSADYDGSQDYDLVLRLSEQAKKIVHIRKILYFWRGHAGSVASDVAAKSYTLDAAKRALTAHLNRIGLKAAVEDGRLPSAYHIKYAASKPGTVHILLYGLREQAESSKASLANMQSPYSVEYHVCTSVAEEEKCLRAILEQKEPGYLLFLNADLQPKTSDWLEEMCGLAALPKAGAVGGMTLTEDGRVLQAGMALERTHGVRYLHRGFREQENGYMSRLTIVQNVSAVSEMCMMLSKEAFAQAGGFDYAFSGELRAADLCMRLQNDGYRQIFTPYAKFVKEKSAGMRLKKPRFAREEVLLLKKKWKSEFAAGDAFAPEDADM